MDNLYIVTGKKQGQRVDIMDRPCTKKECHEWIKDKGVEKYYSDIYLSPYRGGKYAPDGYLFNESIN